MKVIELAKPNTKIVNYFGLEIEVLTSVGYLCVNSDGSLIAWNVIPELFGDRYGVWFADGILCESEYIASIDLEGIDWKTTLRKVS